MAVTQLEHVNVRCADVERSRAFYIGLGLHEGDRPPFASIGYWLYAGDIPIIHLVQAGKTEDGCAGATTGAIDHIAVTACDLGAMRETLMRDDIPYREARVPRDDIVQLIIQDPDGIQIELNFPEK